MSAVLGLVLLVAMASAKRYDVHDVVGIMANTVGPFNNPTEKYPYYSLPICKETKQSKQDAGDTLSGSRQVATTPHDVTFLDRVPWRPLCEDFVEGQGLKVLKDAIEGDYVFEMLIDELPVWGAIGEVVHEEGSLGKSTPSARVYLYPHLLFSIRYNGDQIVTANVTTDARSRVDITDVRNGQEVSVEH